MKTIAAAIGCALLAACAARQQGDAPPQSVAQAPGNELGKVVTTPLSDLGLVHAPIPPVLLAALGNPYAGVRALSCAQLADAVRELDAVLGADLDRPADASDPGLVERGSAAARESAVGAMRGAAEGVVPYRGWVRRLSGAERYSRDVAAAVTAGTVRRAYLKGVGEARGCETPAAPLRRLDQR